MNGAIDMLREFGGLGLAGYLMFWMTRRLNGKLDRLATAVENAADRQDHLEKAIRSNTTAQLKLVRKFTVHEGAMGRAR